MRIQWIDYAKGIGILLVVLGHVLTDYLTHGIKLTDSAYKLLVFIYSFHMPLFFFLSGLFAQKWFLKSNAINSKIKLLVYPYVVWSLIQGSITIFFASEVNNRLTWHSLFTKILFDPYLHLWFIYYLFFCFVGYYLLSKFKLNNVFIFCLSMIGIILARNYSFPWVLNNLLPLFSFFISGILIANICFFRIKSYIFQRETFKNLAAS